MRRRGAFIQFSHLQSIFKLQRPGKRFEFLDRLVTYPSKAHLVEHTGKFFRAGKLALIRALEQRTVRDRRRKDRGRVHTRVFLAEDLGQTNRVVN